MKNLAAQINPGDRIIVLAGSHAQFRNFLAECDIPGKLSIFKYADRREHIMGMRGAKYIKVGQWFLNPIIERHRSLLEVYDMKEIKL